METENIREFYNSFPDLKTWNNNNNKKLPRSHKLLSRNIDYYIYAVLKSI